jgi:hypothetical protein
VLVSGQLDRQVKTKLITCERAKLGHASVKYCVGGRHLVTRALIVVIEQVNER